MFCVGMYRVMPLFGMSTLSVLSSQLVCHTQILLPMQVCRINTLKLHVLAKCYFPIDMRLWNCDTRRSPQAENNMIFSEFTSFYYAVRLLHVPNLVFAHSL